MAISVKKLIRCFSMGASGRFSMAMACKIFDPPLKRFYR